MKREINKYSLFVLALHMLYAVRGDISIATKKTFNRTYQVTLKTMGLNDFVINATYPFTQS